MARKKTRPVVRRKCACVRGGACAPQWLKECATSAPRAMLCGREYLAVENCGQITRLEEDRVCVETALGGVMIEGEGLTVSRENEHTAIVRGSIARISLGCDA